MNNPFSSYFENHPHDPDGPSVEDIRYVHKSLGAPIPGEMTRAEHLTWAKERALEYVDAGDLSTALTSIASDLNKHPETKNHPGVMLGMQLMVSGHLDTPKQMRDHIEGFN